MICCGEAWHRCSWAECGGSPHLPISCPWWMEVDEGGCGDSFIISSFCFGSEDHWSCFFLLPLLMRCGKGEDDGPIVGPFQSNKSRDSLQASMLTRHLHLLPYRPLLSELRSNNGFYSVSGLDG